MRRLAGVGRAVSRILVPRRTASSLPAGPLPTPLLDRLKQPQPQRTHACGDLRISDDAQAVTLVGWLQSVRQFGGMAFAVLRDRTGITQLALRTDTLRQLVADTSVESVVCVHGVVATRPTAMRNTAMLTGEIEVEVTELQLINPAGELPMPVAPKQPNKDETRLRYRYLDLRSPAMQANLSMRSDATHAVRSALRSHNFTEVETPTLFKSTPEGAKEFLVPCSAQPGKSYALPQSPQQYKQLLMAGGVDRYFQLARCYRDESGRADRQPEFTQVDLEMAFSGQQQVMGVVEQMVKHMWKECLDVDMDWPLPRISYADAIRRYGSDKPDTRYDGELCDVSSIIRQSGVKMLQKAAGQPDGAAFAFNARKMLQIPGYDPTKDARLKGLLSIRVENGKWLSPVQKHLEPSAQHELSQLLQPDDGDLLVIAAGTAANHKLGGLRNELISSMVQADLVRMPAHESMLWVEDFPLFEVDPEAAAGVSSAHHPFTAPQMQDLDKLMNGDWDQVHGQHYDLVMAGTELGGGSVRIHDPQLQLFVLERVLGLSPERVEASFGHLMEALSRGCPPHAGFAAGLDRVVAHMVGAQNIREVIAFPKSAIGSDLLTGSPSVPYK